MPARIKKIRISSYQGSEAPRWIRVGGTFSAELEEHQGTDFFQNRRQRLNYNTSSASTAPINALCLHSEWDEIMSGAFGS